MNNILLSLNLVIPLAFMMAVGYICKRCGMIGDKSLAEMNTVQFRGFMSLLIFYNVYELDLSSHGRGSLLLFSYAVIAFEILLSWLVFRKMTDDKRKISVLMQGIFRTNLLIFGLSVAQSLYGDGKIGDVVILLSIIVPSYNVISVIVFEVFRGGKIKPWQMFLGVLKNPLIVGAVFGLFFLILKTRYGIPLPKMLENPIATMSKAASPLAFVILGATLTFGNLFKNLKYLTVLNLMRLVLIPLLVLPLAIKLGYRNQALVALFGVTATPTAVSSFNVAKDMGADGDLAGEIVVTTSICSIVTTFLWVLILKNLAFI
jgi:predicted permease